MPRPKAKRDICDLPKHDTFAPEDIIAKEFEVIVLMLDEYEAVRLSDFEGLYQDDASKLMNISRATFGRVLSSARSKIAEALVLGKILRIEGGVVQKKSKTKCNNCRMVKCPKASACKILRKEFFLN